MHKLRPTAKAVGPVAREFIQKRGKKPSVFRLGGVVIRSVFRFFPLLFAFLFTFFDFSFEFGFRLLEFPHAFTHTAGEFGDFLGTEEEKDDQEDDYHLLHAGSSES